jgi:uncharacterized membrane protein (DUF373 family)
VTTFERIKRDYSFTGEDEERIKSLYPLVEERADLIVENLERYLIEMGVPELIEKLDAHPDLKNYHKNWLLTLFKGPYDSMYYRQLLRIGNVHASKDIKPHHLSVAMNNIRATLMDMLSKEVDDRKQRTELKGSLNKLIDINLDVITSSYVESEIEQYSAGYRLRTSLVAFAEKFSSTMNLVLVFALIIITLGVVALFFYDVVALAQGDFSYGIITALGSLLILWVLIELMNTEIAHLKGGRFNISVFIGVALVAFIRDLMIATLKHEKINTAYYLVVTILVLGFVYWLVIKAEVRRRE